MMMVRDVEAFDSDCEPFEDESHESEHEDSALPSMSAPTFSPSL